MADQEETKYTSTIFAPDNVAVITGAANGIGKSELSKTPRPRLNFEVELLL